jgi:plastocyanin
MMTRFSLALLTFVVAGCSAGTDHTADDSNLAPHDILIKQSAASLGPSAFDPAHFTISLATSTTVKWLNRDFSGNGPYGGGSGVTHRLVSDDGITFASGNITSNGIFTATLSTPGSYGYHCSIHPAMTGTLTVNP